MSDVMEETKEYHDQQNDELLIRENDSVIIRLHDEKSCYIVKVKGVQKINRARVAMDGMIGHSYGSVFEVITSSGGTSGNNGTNKSSLVYLSKESRLDDFMTVDASALVTDHIKGDNSKFSDTNTAQKLKDDDIQRLRASGASSNEIIQSLIQNSDSWGDKTVFAQEKWMKKKQQKYAKRFRVMKATPYNICEVYNIKNRDKTCGIREDTLAQILYQSGVHAGSKVLIFESVIGLIVGSVAYQLRGHGQILAIFDGQQPHFEMVSCLNLLEKDCDIIQPVPSVEIASAVDEVLAQGFHTPAATVSSSPPPSSSESSEELESNAHGSVVMEDSEIKEGKKDSKRARVETSEDKEDTNNSNGNNNNSGETIRRHHTSGRQPEDVIKLRAALRQGSNSLIIASRFHPLPIFKELLSLLAPSSSFVVYFEYMEPLVECYLFAQARGDCLRLKLFDTWMREYQTLPGRVHPQMYMRSTGGYLLTGIYVGTVPQALASSSSTNANNDDKLTGQQL